MFTLISISPLERWPLQKKLGCLCRLKMQTFFELVLIDERKQSKRVVVFTYAQTAANQNALRRTGPINTPAER